VGRYVLIRLLWVVPVLLGVSLIVFGSAVSKRPVVDEIASRVRPTAELALAALLLAVTVGLAAGVVSATRQYTLWDNLATLIALFGVSMPIFWLGLMLMMVFSVELGWLPSSGAGTPAQLVLPAIALGSASTAIIARQTRSGMLEVLRQDYVQTARAKGLSERTTILRHALKNALIPTVTVAGLQVGYLLGGAVLTETVFARPGLGRLLVDSIRTRDIAVVQATIMLLSATFVLVNLVVDVLYVALDPRIRYD
jgi:peptide/nickel transport system permease protein